MLLENILPVIPVDRLQYIIFAVSIIGALMLVYSQFVEAENRRDLMRMVGSLALLVYAVWILNLLFILTMLGIFIASLVEFIEIYTGYHKHTRKDVQIYEHIGKGSKY